MQVVILAGGYGTRLTEETTVKPKPMVEIGGRPILWHIMKLYSHYGLNDFIVCCGYKANVIKDYFASYRLHASDVTFDFRDDRFVVHSTDVEDWRVTLLDTGENTMTGGRLRRAAAHLESGTFCLTYGDCLTDIDISRLVGAHKESGATATLTAVQPPGRFGVLTFGSDQFTISSFLEKPRGDGGWVNGGFFVLESSVLDYVGGDETVWEREPLEALAREGKLHAYRHHGYWQNMDSLRDKMVLEEQWASGSPPWRVWDGPKR
jgi:glucose-1-phosphate cytidylyltransferase